MVFYARESSECGTKAFEEFTKLYGMCDCRNRDLMAIFIARFKFHIYRQRQKARRTLDRYSY